MGNSQPEDIYLKRARLNVEKFIKHQNKNKKLFLASKKAYAHNDYNGPLVKAPKINKYRIRL